MNVSRWPCVQWTIYKSEPAFLPRTLNLLSGKSLQQDPFFKLDTPLNMWTCYNRKNQTSCQLLPAKIEEWTPLSLHHNQSRVHEALQKSDAISTYARVILISVYIHRKLEIMLKHQLQRPSSKGPSGCEPRPIGAHKCSVRDKWWQTMHPSSKLNSLRCISMVIAWGTGLQVVHSGHTWGGWIPFIEGGSDGNQGGVAT